MHTFLYDLQAAEAHWHDLQVEAEHERLVKQALEERRKGRRSSRLNRYFEALRGRNPDGSRVEPRKN